MNLVGYTATALSRNDIEDTPTNKNVVDGAIVELKTLSGDLVVIYDDESGTNPETQKACDSDGQCEFYAEAGDYNLEVNGKVNKISLFFNKDKVNDIAAWGDRFVGYFVDGFTYTTADDVAKGIDGKYYSYGGASAYPVAVTAGTVPSAPTYMPVVLSDTESVKNTDGSSAQDTYDATKALLVAQGFSGNYGFFEKGFTYSAVGDVGIDADGEMWKLGSGASVVSAGDIPSEPSYIKVLKNYSNIVYVDSKGLGGIIDDTQAVIAAVQKATALQYVKRGVKVVFRSPVNYYQISESINLNELWNVSIECESKNAWNRSEFGALNTQGGNIHWIGNATDSLFRFGSYCFGTKFENIMVNGLDNLKIAFDMSAATPSVLRDTTFVNCGAKYVDFCAVHGDISGTDIAPVLWINPVISNCKSAAILNNSGNLQITIQGGFITNNGSSPSTGNSFIPDADNLGYQLLQRAGHLWMYGTTLDGSGVNLPASGTNIRIAGGTAHLDGWDDTPQVVSVDSASVAQSVTFGNWRHFDGSMTAVNTPVSIKHRANFCMSGAGLNVFGNIEVESGNQAAFNDDGVNFLNSASGFTGSAIALGALARTNQSGFNEVIGSTGGDFIPVGDDTIPATHSYHSRPNRPFAACRSRTTNSKISTETVKDNGDRELLINTWYDTASSQYKSITAGSCTRLLTTASGLSLVGTQSTAAANEVVTFSNSAGTRKGSNPNGDYQLEISGRVISFDTPTGSVTRGSLYFERSPAASGRVGQRVITSGVVGSTAVLEDF